VDTSDRGGAVTDCVPGGVEPMTKLLVKGGGVLTEKFLAIGDSIPPNTLLNQEGLQLAEASFCDISNIYIYMCTILYIYYLVGGFAHLEKY